MPTKDVQKKREQNRNLKADQRAHERDVANFDYTIKNVQRRLDTQDNLAAWLKAYFPESCSADFAPCHYQLTDTVESIINHGGRVVYAFPRGSGKTTISVRALLWAVLNGHSRFALLLSCDTTQAKQRLADMVAIIESNERLAEDYPEIILPLRALEGAALRAMYQHYNEEKTRVEFSASKGIRFPAIPDAMEPTGELEDGTVVTFKRNAEAILKTASMGASGIRGASVMLTSGKQVRPDLALVDDPQDDESAYSRTSILKREKLLNSTIAGLAGFDKPIAILCALTVIAPDDLACRLMDPNLNPDWIGIKIAMLESMPEDLDLWDKYNETRKLEAGLQIERGAANKFYEEHREALEAGAVHYWPERVDSGKISAVQSAMDEYLKDPKAFASEYQNEPRPLEESVLPPLSSVLLTQRMSHVERGVVPSDAAEITAMIDVQQGCLYYSVIGWSQSFKGYVLDYGIFPKQASNALAYSALRKTLGDWSKGNNPEGAVQAGVEALVNQLTATEYRTKDGRVMTITAGAVDAGYLPDQVELGIASSGSRLFLPSRGWGITANSTKEVVEFTKVPGWKAGDHWLRQRPAKREFPWLHFDSNYWKTQVYHSLAVPKESEIGLTFYKHKYKTTHGELSEQLVSEICVKGVSRTGKERIEWTLPSNSTDNHMLDCVTGCMVLASTLGIRKDTDGQPRRRKRRRGKATLKT